MTTNDTRTLTKIQAEAAELYPMPRDGDGIENACAYAARHAHIAALTARDAEPTTVTAEELPVAIYPFALRRGQQVAYEDGRGRWSVADGGSYKLRGTKKLVLLADAPSEEVSDV